MVKFEVEVEVEVGGHAGVWHVGTTRVHGRRLDTVVYSARAPDEPLHWMSHPNEK